MAFAAMVKKNPYLNLEQRYNSLGDSFTFRTFLHKWLEDSYHIVGWTSNTHIEFPKDRQHITIEEFHNLVFNKIYHNNKCIRILWMNPKTGGYKTWYKIAILAIVEYKDRTKIIDSFSVFAQSKKTIINNGEK